MHDTRDMIGRVAAAGTVHVLAEASTAHPLYSPPPALTSIWGMWGMKVLQQRQQAVALLSHCVVLLRCMAEVKNRTNASLCRLNASDLQ